MSKHNNGGPAFPADIGSYSALGAEITISTPGMTLRDYFAAVVAPDTMNDWRYGGPMSEPESEDEAEQDWMLKAARQCYAFADAMLAAREGKNDD